MLVNVTRILFMRQQLRTRIYYYVFRKEFNLIKVKVSHPLFYAETIKVIVATVVAALQVDDVELATRTTSALRTFPLNLYYLKKTKLCERRHLTTYFLSWCHNDKAHIIYLSSCSENMSFINDPIQLLSRCSVQLCNI